MFELPDKFTKEFIEELEWRPGPLDIYEISEFGLVRRPYGIDIRGVYPGFLYSPNISMKRRPHYRLNPGGDKAATYLMPEVVIKEIFGVFKNKKLLNNEYAHNMKSLVIEYNALNFKKKRRPSYELAEESGMTKSRRCCDCGAKTRNYRCDACWTIIRSMSTSCDEPSKEYRILGGR